MQQDDRVTDVPSTPDDTLQILQERLRAAEELLVKQKEQRQFVQLQLQNQQTQQHLVALQTQISLFKQAQDAQRQHQSPVLSVPSSMCSEMAADSKFMYTPLSLFGRCPPGYRATGCHISSSNELRQLACKRPRQTVAPCTERSRHSWYEYTTKINGTCPSGWEDTGCDTSTSTTLQQLACKRLSTKQAVPPPSGTSRRGGGPAHGPAHGPVRSVRPGKRTPHAVAQTPPPSSTPQPQNAVEINPSTLLKKWGVSNIKPHFSVKNGYFEVVHQKGQAGSSAGGTFTTNPLGMFPKTRATMSYEVFMPSGWQPVKGGKLPGFCLGRTFKDCSNGGDWRKDQGSVRVMWQKKGKAILYVYLTTGNSQTGYNQQRAAYKTAAGGKAHPTGHGLFKNAPWVFKAGAWNKVSIEVEMNDVGQANGVLGLTINGHTERLADVILRDNNAVQINSVKITSFYGGNSKAWAPPSDTVMQFKNFVFS